MNRLFVHAMMIAAVLGAIAASAPSPSTDDRGTYRDVGRDLLIRDCASIHCFRVLVAAVLEHVPGPSLVKWKAYAVLANTGAAFAVARFCLLLGLSGSAAVAAGWLSALGAGSLYSLFDCYTSDPFMYMIGPLIAVAVWEGRIGRAGWLSGIGVFAKEFAAAPLWIFAGVAALEHRRRAAVRLLLTSVAVSFVWVSMQLALRVLLNYRNGATESSNLAHGAYLVFWLRSVGMTNAAVYLFITYGALYLLLPVGIARNRRNLHLALASLPAVAAFVYVQQPERALWNFHFIVIPIAVYALQELPDWAMGAFAVSFGISNLRFGAQLPLRRLAHVSLAVSVAIAVVAIVVSLSGAYTGARSGRAGSFMSRVVSRAATSIVSFLLALEIGLRIYNPFPFRIRGDHIVLPAHQSYTIAHIDAQKMDPVTHVTKNSLGFRGPEPPRDLATRFSILTIGGSTTECLFLSDGKTWTDQLTRRLAAIRREDVWVNNAGFEGHSTFGHLVLMREFVVELRPKMAIFLTGFNDMKLASPKPIDNELNPQNLSVAHRALTWMADHSEIAAVGENFIRMARTYRAGVRTTEIRLEQLKRQPLDEEKAALIIDEHRTRFLGGYARRLTEIVEISRRNGIEPVLVTQPALYGDLTDPTTGVALGTAWVEPVSNGRVEWQSLELYNDEARHLSARAGVRLIDLAHELPKDSRYFTDWVHYTNEGAVLVGDIVFKHLEPWLGRGK